MAEAKKGPHKSNGKSTGAAKRKTAASKKKTNVKRAAKNTGIKSVKASQKPPLLKVVRQALDDIKAINVAVFDVRELTDVTDTMVIASGNSDRHVRSIADRVTEAAKKAGFRPMGVEGERDGEWVLVDLQDVILHVMLPRVRDLYRLENLWDVSAARREAAGG